MKKLTVCAITFWSFMVTQPLQAQVPLPGVNAIKPAITLGASLVYSMPQGDFKEGYKYGFGGELFGGIGWGSTFLIATVGASAFSAEANNGAGTLTSLPIKIGVKKFFLLNKLFLNGDVGIASVKNKAFSESAFTAGVGAGAKLLGLELALYYSTLKPKDKDALNALNAKVGYSFSL